MEPPLLRLLIQEKLADGRLPRAPFPSIKGRQGDGEICDGCGETVTGAQTLMEVLDARECGVRVHIVCYYVWIVERQAYGCEPGVRLPARSAFRAVGDRTNRSWAAREPAARPTSSSSP